MRRAAAGFTLLEMLVVLAILGLLSIIALPPLRLNEGTRLREVAHRLATDVRLARQEAMRRGDSTAIAQVDRGYVVLPSGRTEYLPAGVTLAAEIAAEQFVPNLDGSVHFFADGSSTGGTLTVQQGDVSVRLVIRGIDGKATLDER